MAILSACYSMIIPAPRMSRRCQRCTQLAPEKHEQCRQLIGEGRNWVIAGKIKAYKALCGRTIVSTTTPVWTDGRYWYLRPQRCIVCDSYGDCLNIAAVHDWGGWRFVDHFNGKGAAKQQTYTLGQVLVMVKINKKVLHKLIRQKSFPGPVTPGVWNADDVDRWIFGQVVL